MQRCLLILNLALLTFLSLPAAAQEPAEPSAEAPAEDFFDVVEVEIVNIDVFVTDKKGQPVAGLTRDDFAVFSDGRQVEVTNFYAVEDGREQTNRAAGTTDIQAPERQPSLSLSTQLAPEHRLWMIVYVDNYNLDSIERKRVFPCPRTSAIGCCPRYSISTQLEFRLSR